MPKLPVVKSAELIKFSGSLLLEFVPQEQRKSSSGHLPLRERHSVIDAHIRGVSVPLTTHCVLALGACTSNSTWPLQPPESIIQISTLRG